MATNFFAGIPCSDCWLWKGPKDGGGYGLTHLDGRSQSVHRVMVVLATGQPIPEGLFVLHSCDNPPCVNPSHLRVGTHQENMDDMVRKGRQRTPLGVSHGKSKLNDDIVRRIRVMASGGMTQRAIAAVFGVWQATIRDVLNGRTWGHVQQAMAATK